MVVRPHSKLGHWVQVLIPEGPTSYGIQALHEASGLAMKMVANYGLTEEGITTFAPPLQSFSDVGTKYETAVDEIDDDTFGAADDTFQTTVTEDMVGSMKETAQILLLDAYEYDLVCLILPQTLYIVSQ